MEQLLDPTNLKNVSLADLAKKDYLTSLKNNLNSYLPSLNIWLIRIGLGYQAYLYHSGIGIFHLSYVLLSFFFSRKFTYLLTIYVMLPVYCLEFIFIYGLGVHGMN